jgi:phosphoesterase RecJ-like protein
MKHLLKILKTNKKFLLVSHIDPDGDVLCSVLTLNWLLRQWGKQTWMFAKDPLPSRYRFLPGIKRIHASIPVNFRPQVIVVLDTPSLERTGFKPPAGVPIINIDHHPSNLHYADYNWVESTASSTSELLYRLIRQAKIRFDTEVAFIIYCGIFAETGGFSYPNTKPETLMAGARLLHFGFSPDTVSTKLNATSPENIQLLSRVLATLETRNGIASIHLSRAMRKPFTISPENLDSDNFIRFPMMVRGVKVAVFLREEKKNLTRVSLRSQGEVDVDRVARSLGGGGHRTAAGVKIRKPLPIAKREVWKAAERFMARGGC